MNRSDDKQRRKLGLQRTLLFLAIRAALLGNTRG